MITATVNVSFPRPLLKRMDALARQEARSRSELLREAARLYVERKHRWERIFSFGRQQAKRLAIKPADVQRVIDEFRQGRSRGH